MSVADYRGKRYYARNGKVVGVESPPESMEERFDEVWGNAAEYGSLRTRQRMPEEIKDFIRQELALARNSALDEAIEAAKNPEPYIYVVAKLKELKK